MVLHFNFAISYREVHFEGNRFDRFFRLTEFTNLSMLLAMEFCYLDSVIMTALFDYSNTNIRISAVHSYKIS